MDRSIRRLTDLLRRSNDYTEFERKVMKFPKWYLVGLQTWTKANLYAFYGQYKGR